MQDIHHHSPEPCRFFSANREMPVEPERKYCCASYDRCLMYAARKDWHLSCAGCQKYAPVKVELTDMDRAGCMALLHTVFDPAYADDGIWQ